jgi:hypothetical protein
MFIDGLNNVATAYTGHGCAWSLRTQPVLISLGLTVEDDGGVTPSRSRSGSCRCHSTLTWPSPSSSTFSGSSKACSSLLLIDGLTS